MLFAHAPVAGPRCSGRAPVAPLRFAQLCPVKYRQARAGSRTAAAAAPAEVFDAQVCVVLGTQWGDEGKGKLVDILAQQYDIVARAQVCSGPSLGRHAETNMPNSSISE